MEKSTIDHLCETEAQVAARMDTAIMNAQDRLLPAGTERMTDEQEHAVLADAVRTANTASRAAHSERHEFVKMVALKCSARQIADWKAEVGA